MSKKNEQVEVQTLTLTTFTQDRKKDFITKVETLKKEVGIYKITDQVTRSKASEFLSRIKHAFNFLEDRRVEYVKPFNDEVKRINNEFKFIQNPLTELEGTIKAEMKRDYNEQEKIRMKKEAELKKIEDEKIAKLKKDLESKNALIRAAAETKAESIIAVTEQKLVSYTPQNIVRTAEGKTSFRKIWKWELEDFSKLPESWKTTNDIMINAAIKSGQREIPGLKIYEDVTVGGGK